MVSPMGGGILEKTKGSVRLNKRIFGFLLFSRYFNKDKITMKTNQIKWYYKAIAIAFFLTLTITTAQATPLKQSQKTDEVTLKLWPENAATRLERLINRFAFQGRYAVFDCDNTIWYRDLEESLLPYLEQKGVLTKDVMDPSLKIIPFLKKDTLNSYAYRLYDIDHKVGYPWIAQIFSGFTLNQLKTHVDDLYAMNGGKVPAQYWSNGTLVDYEVETPRIYPGMRELINVMMENGIEVYLVSAAHEELVRMVATDPQYGLNVKPENVIGVSTLLRDPKTLEVTTARKQVEIGHFYDEEYTKEKHMNMVVTPTLWSPNTMYHGKVWAINDYIHPVKRPILVAGDSPNDHLMLFEADESVGVKLWINRKEAYWEATQEAMEIRHDQQVEARYLPSAKHRWIMVRPADIGIE